MVTIEVQVDIGEYVSDIPTRLLKWELANRLGVPEARLVESPHQIIDDLQRAFDRRDVGEFSYIIGKIRNIVEMVDAA